MAVSGLVHQSTYLVFASAHLALFTKALRHVSISSVLKTYLVLLSKDVSLRALEVVTGPES